MRLNNLIIFLTIWGFMHPSIAWCLDAETGNIADEEAVDDNIISIYGTSCERFKAGEAKSSVRVRATDKASFKAVENIPELVDYHKKTNSHDFNVIVYNLVDNFLEDLTVRTTEQNVEKICVEVTGYLNIDNILNALNNNFTKKQELAKTDPVKIEEKVEAPKYPDELVIEDKQSVKKIAVTGFPPKPEIKINEAIAAENVEIENKKKDVVAINSNDIKIHLLPTKFFNGQTTSNYLPILQDIIANEPNLKLSEQAYEANYIIKSEVLRAKVDPLNKQTSRLQMVVAVTLEDVATNTSSTEHQNRFILFENTEDEQTVANNLMDKLLKKAGEQVMQRLLQKSRLAKKEQGGIITPTSSTYNPQENR